MLKIGILAGGLSVEHEVSLASGRNVLKYIDRKKYKPYFLLLTKDKRLFWDKKQIPFPRGLKHFDIVFNALHGTFGEDGELQKILDRAKIKHTGSDARASKLGMDKWVSRKLFKKAGLTVPKSRLIKKISDKIAVSFPAVAKPRNGGSSVGVSISSSASELKNKLRKILENDDAIIEEYLSGREFTGGVLEYKNKLRALPVVEIKPKPKYGFFDYEAKYKTGASDEIVPAKISRMLAKKIQNAALRAHGAIGASAYSRSDFILRRGKVYILEINTLPGLTKNSLIPKAARAAGIPFTKLIGIIIDSVPG